MKRASLNHTYRLVWSERLQAFVAVAEITRTRGKRSSGAVALTAAALLGAFGAAHAAEPGALPTGGEIVAGTGQIDQAGRQMTVTQSSDRLIANWNTFNIGADASVQFVQPDASSAALNRVLDSNPSQIFGSLTANGRVFLLNPNGILFGSSAQVNVGGLVASSLDLSNEDFLAGRYVLRNGGNAGRIDNQGALNSTHGVVALVAPQVSNTGAITANGGSVALAAGDKVGLDFQGDGLVTVNVDQGTYNALVENRGLIQADGGLVAMTAKSASTLLETVVNNEGVVQAQTLEAKAGRILLLGDMAHGRVNVGGVLDASAPGAGDGGFIETSAAEVAIDPSATVTTLSSQGRTGEWLIDPNDYTIAASGGNITGAALATSLNSTNVTIQTTSQGTGGGNGDIFVNDTISKTGGSATTLTLLAERNIEVNQAITTNSGRLNVVLTPDSDANNTGSVSFGSSGRVVTNSGNFYVGSVSGVYDTVTARGQNFSMDTGSYINVGQGNLDISVNGTVSLPDNSAEATTYALSSTYQGSSAHFLNNGSQYWSWQAPFQYLRVSGSSITTANTDAAIADILTSVDTTLSAGTIGSALTPIKLSGPSGLNTGSQNFPAYARVLTIANSSGSSYVSEMGNQIYGTINVNIGSQASATQNVQIMGDAGGDGTSGTGHIIMNTDGSGVLALGTGDIKTFGIAGNYNSVTPANSIDPSVFPTSVSISASNITFADNAVDTGTSTFYWLYPNNHNQYPYYTSASFSAYASSSMTSSSNNSTGDIRGVTVSLTGPSIGSASNPVEVAGGSTLNIYNTGGSTYVRSVDNSFYGVNLTNVKTVGTHSILFSNGDHIDYATDGSGLLVSTLGARSDGSTFGATTGVDGTDGNRSVSFTANSGYIEYDTNSVNVGSGSFTTNISSINSDRNAGRAIYATNAKDGSAEITAGSIGFSMNSTTAGAISGLELAKGGAATNSTLTLSTYGGNIDLAELTANNFKSIVLNLYGNNVAQNVAIDLVGADDVNFSDSGSLITLDATKVALSANNRNFTLSSNGRNVQIDSNSLSTGNYAIYANALGLNGDVLTDGGVINLYGYGGVTLRRALRIDSNADDLSNTTSTGASGSITVYGTMSSLAPGYALTVDSASSTTSGGAIQFYSNLANASGAYLSGLSTTSKGSTNTNDGAIYFYGTSYLLNGNFSSIGNTYLYGSNTTIDTEQGNTANAGNITFGGYNLNGIGSYAYAFNTATTAAGMNGGNVDLFGTYQRGTFTSARVNITSTGGTGGTAGNITLPAMSAVTNGFDNSQSYAGGVITLNGNVSTERGSVTMSGDVRLASNVTIDTWQSAAANVTQTGTAGAVTITGTGVSATSASRALTINTNTDTGSGYYNTPTNTQTWTHNGGAVNIKTGNAGGYYVDSVNVNTGTAGTYNTGAAGAITLSGVSTTGNQTYAGGATTVSGDLLTNGGNINLSGAASLALSGGPIAIKTDMTGGANAAGTLNIGSFNLNAPVALTIDTTADGGGNGTDFTLPLVGNTTALTSLNARARNLTVSGDIIAGGVTLGATNSILLGADATINTSGSNGNIALNAAVDSTGSARALTLNAGTGTTTLGGAVGSSLALSSLAITGSSIALNGGAVTTSGAQTYNGSTMLGANASLTTTNSGITFNGTVNSSGSNRSLTTSTGSGVTTFGNRVGNALALSSLSAGNTAINTSAITTTGAQTYSGAVTLGFDDSSGAPYRTTLTTSNGNVTFASTVDDTAIDKHELEIAAGTGTVTFSGDVGGSVEPFALYVTGPTTLGADITVGRAEFFSAVTLASDVTLTQTCCYGVHFHSTVDGAHALTMSVGSVSFDGAVGGTSALTSLDVTGETTLGGNVTTVGTQTYDGDVRLISTNTVLEQTGANTDFTLQANRSITNVTGVDANLTIRTARDIVLAGGSSIDSDGGKLNVALNARAQDGASGAIVFNDGVSGGASSPVSILSNGGDIKLTGGSSGNGYAIAGANSYTYGADQHQNGVSLAHVMLDSRVYVGGVAQESGGGDIIIKAQGYAGNVTTHGGGVWAGNSSFLTGGGDFSLEAWAQRSGNPTTGGIRYGAFLDTMTLTTSGGNVSITTPAPSQDTGLYFFNVSPRTLNAGGGNIAITTDTLDLANNQTFQSTGALWIQPYTSGTTIGLAGGAGTLSLSASHLSGNFADGFSQVTIGNGTAGAISVGGATTFNDNIVLVSGGNIDIGNAIDASGQTLTLTAGSGASATGSGNITAANLLLNGTNASYVLNTAAANSIGTLAASNVAGVNFRNAGSFAVGSVNGVDGVSGSGAVTLEANGANADLTLGKAVTSTGGNVILAAGRNFINNNAAGSGINAASGRYLVYSSNPADTTEGLSGYSKHYNQTYTPGATPSYASTGNWFLYSVAPVLSVSPNSATTTYGDAASFTQGISGFIDGDTLASAGVSGTAVFNVGGGVSGAGHATAGQHDVSYASGLASSLGYGFQDNAASSNELTVNRAQVQVTGVSADNRVYDATTNASLSGVARVATLAGDAVVVAGSGTGTFADKNVGAGKGVSVTGYTLAGNDAANYEAAQPTGLSADVTRAVLTVAGVSLPGKAYDGNSTAEVSNYGTLQGVIGNDAVGLDTTSATATYNDAQIGNGKEVSIAGLVLNGVDAANYELVMPNGTADITSNANTAVNAVSTSVITAAGSASGEVSSASAASDRSGSAPSIQNGASAESVSAATNRPLVIDLTGASSGATPLVTAPTFTESSNAVTLSFGNSGNAFSTPQSNVLPVYHGGADGAAPHGHLNAVDKGNSLTLTPASSGAATRPLSMGTTTVSKQTVVTLPDGASEALTISVTDAGILVIGTSSNNLDVGLNEEKVIALAIQYAKENLGVSVEALKGVVITNTAK